VVKEFKLLNTGHMCSHLQKTCWLIHPPRPLSQSEPCADVGGFE